MYIQPQFIDARQQQQQKKEDPLWGSLKKLGGFIDSFSSPASSFSGFGLGYDPSSTDYGFSMGQTFPVLDGLSMGSETPAHYDYPDPYETTELPGMSPMPAMGSMYPNFAGGITNNPYYMGNMQNNPYMMGRTY